MSDDWSEADEHIEEMERKILGMDMAKPGSDTGVIALPLHEYQAMVARAVELEVKNRELEVKIERLKEDLDDAQYEALNQAALRDD